MDYSIFSQRLTELVESRGKNISGVAVDIGVTPATISRYVVGIRYPDLRIVIRLANYFNVSMEWLIGLSDDRLSRGDENLEELVHLYSLASSDDRAVVDAVLSKYKRNVKDGG